MGSMKNEIKQLAVNLQKQGGRAFLVGGSVRDMLLGKTPDNYDIEVYGLSLSELKKILSQFGTVSEVGKSFGVLKLTTNSRPRRSGKWIEIDVSVPRIEKKSGKGHRGFKVQTIGDLDITKALLRRDFTINSMAYDPLTKELSDPFGGQKDLKNKILRVTNSKTFAEDPLRVLRAMQFVSRFNLKIAPQTAKIISKAVPSVIELPKERVWQEWRKLILKSKKPSLGIDAGMKLRVFKVLHPQFLPLVRTKQEPTWHSEGNVWVHSLKAIDNGVEIAGSESLEQSQKLTLALAAFCHDIGKATTTKKMGGKIRSLGHAAAGEAPTKDFLQQIGADKKTISQVAKLVVLHMKQFGFYHRERHGQAVPSTKIYELADELDKVGLNIDFLILLSRVDFYAKGGTAGKKHMEGEWLKRQAKKLGVLYKPAGDVVRGEDLINLDLKPGKQFGQIIKLSNRLHREKGYSQERIIALISKLAQNKKVITNSLSFILNS